MKHVVIKYAIHNECIDDYHVCDTHEEAKSYLVNDADAEYQHFVNEVGLPEDEIPECEISFNVIEGEFAHLSVDEGDYEYTWEIIMISC